MTITNVPKSISIVKQWADADTFGEEGMMQADGVHPTQMAQPRLLENAWQRLAPLLQLTPAQ